MQVRVTNVRETLWWNRSIACESWLEPQGLDSHFLNDDSDDDKESNTYCDKEYDDDNNKIHLGREGVDS